MAAIEPTTEQLQRAWQECRRASWPATFEEAMADATLARVVRITAKYITGRRRSLVGFVAAAMTPARAGRRPAPVFDAKRAAAGDRDDD